MNKKYVLPLVAILALQSCNTKFDPIQEAKSMGLAQATVAIYSGGGGGTGVVIKAKSGKAVLLTNKHICDMGDGLLAVNEYMPFQEPVRPELKASWHDVCILNAPQALIDDAVELAAMDPQYGERILVLGHPLLRTLTATFGHIYGASLFAIFMGDGDIVMFWAWYTEAFSAPGSSGSPVFNSEGKVVALLFAGSSKESLLVPRVEIERALLGF